MDIDKKIKEELESEAKQLDQILVQQDGIFTMLANAYKGALGGWVILVSIIALVVTGFIVWAGYEFFFVESTITHKLHWAVVLIIALVAQVSLKMWTFMEMNRQSTMRELKRIEIAINTNNHK